MAHYAFLDENNIVTSVIAGPDESDGTDYETLYSEFKGQVCKRTSYNTHANIHKEGNTPFRKNYAGIGYTYDDVLDAFIPPQPFTSWKLNEETCNWEAPIPSPDTEQPYVWNEENYRSDSLSGWVIIEN